MDAQERPGRRRRGISVPMDGQVREAVLEGGTFQVREAVTLRTAGETPAPPAAAAPAGDTFQVREAVTRTEDPPHWAALREAAAAAPELESAAVPEPAIEPEPPAPPIEQESPEPEAAPPAGEAPEGGRDARPTKSLPDAPAQNEEDDHAPV